MTMPYSPGRALFEGNGTATDFPFSFKVWGTEQLTVTLTDAAKDYLIAKGYDPIYGARPLKRLIQTEVETLLARWIIAEDPAPETAITVDYDGEKLVAM